MHKKVEENLIGVDIQQSIAVLKTDVVNQLCKMEITGNHLN